MFWKKNEKPASPRGSSFAKKAERRFFHIFNAKTRVRRIALVGLMAWVPAYGIAKLNHESPDTYRSPEGAAQAQQYDREVSHLIQYSHDPAVIRADQPGGGPIADADIAAWNDFQEQVRNITRRLVFDQHISEADADRLLKRLKNETQEGLITERLNQLIRTSAYLDQAHMWMKHNEGLTEEDAANPSHAQFVSLQNHLQDYKDDEYWYRFALTYVLLFGGLQAGSNLLLRRGSRRDDTLKQEERDEIYDETRRDIRDILTPKTPVARSAASPRRKPEPKP